MIEPDMNIISYSVNLFLRVGKDFKGSMLLEKIITHGKGLFKLREWTKNRNL